MVWVIFQTFNFILLFTPLKNWSVHTKVSFAAINRFCIFLNLAQLAEQNSKMCKIYISQRDVIERKPFSIQKVCKCILCKQEQEKMTRHFRSSPLKIGHHLCMCFPNTYFMKMYFIFCNGFDQI